MSTEGIDLIRSSRDSLDRKILRTLWRVFAETESALRRLVDAGTALDRIERRSYLAGTLDELSRTGLAVDGKPAWWATTTVDGYVMSVECAWVEGCEPK